MTVAVITGGGGDLGTAIAARLAADDITVVLADRNTTAARSAAAGIRGALAIDVDVTDPASIHNLVHTVDETLGRLDALICCAGVEPPHDLATMSLETWDTTQQVNLRGPALLAQAALPLWQRQHSGTIVNIGSRTWLGGGHPAYAASKAGLVGLTEQCSGLVDRLLWRMRDGRTFPSE